MAKPLGIWYDDCDQILTLGDALGSELWPLLCPMLPPNVQILSDDIFLTWPHGHHQSWFLVFYYWISHEKSNDVYIASGGWTFCEFVDFQLYSRFWGAFEMRLRCVWNDFEERLSNVWVAFEKRLRSVWGAFEVRLRCVWNTFEARSKCVWIAFEIVDVDLPSTITTWKPSEL